MQGLRQALSLHAQLTSTITKGGSGLHIWSLRDSGDTILIKPVADQA